MHEPVLKVIAEYIGEKKADIERGLVADLGGRDFNGCVKDLLPQAVSFDIHAGDRVDVVIEPGVIPDVYLHKFQHVFATSVINFCLNEEEFFSEVEQLAAPGADIFICGCTDKCPYDHDNGQDKYIAYRKYPIKGIGYIARRHFDGVEVIDLGTDFIIKARRRPL